MVEIGVVGIAESQIAQLEQLLFRASEELGLDIQVNKISDIDVILTYEAGGIPFILYDQDIYFDTHYPSYEELREFLLEVQNAEQHHHLDQ